MAIYELFSAKRLPVGLIPLTRANRVAKAIRTKMRMACLLMTLLTCTSCEQLKVPNESTWSGQLEGRDGTSGRNGELASLHHSGGLLEQLRFVNKLNATSAHALRELRDEVEDQYAAQPTARHGLKLALLLGDPRLGEVDAGRVAALRSKAISDIARSDLATATALIELFSLVQNHRESQRRSRQALRASQAQLAQRETWPATRSTSKYSIRNRAVA